MPELFLVIDFFTPDLLIVVFLVVVFVVLCTVFLAVVFVVLCTIFLTGTAGWMVKEIALVTGVQGTSALTSIAPDWTLLVLSASFNFPLNCPFALVLPLRCANKLTTERNELTRCPRRVRTIVTCRTAIRLIESRKLAALLTVRVSLSPSCTSLGSRLKLNVFRGVVLQVLASTVACFDGA